MAAATGLPRSAGWEEEAATTGDAGAEVPSAEPEAQSASSAKAIKASKLDLIMVVLRANELAVCKL
jgi:hypothetical protein